MYCTAVKLSRCSDHQSACFASSFHNVTIESKCVVVNPALMKSTASPGSAVHLLSSRHQLSQRAWIQWVTVCFHVPTEVCKTQCRGQEESENPRQRVDYTRGRKVKEDLDGVVIHLWEVEWWSVYRLQGRERPVNKSDLALPKLVIN